MYMYVAKKDINTQVKGMHLIWINDKNNISNSTITCTQTNTHIYCNPVLL